MLLRGIYAFEPRPEDHEHTLPFACNDKLIFYDVLKRDSNWLRVIDILGRIGYVPKIFVEPDDNYSNSDLILSFLLDAVMKARKNGLESATYLENFRNQLRKNPKLLKERTLQLKNVFLHPSQVTSGSNATPRATRSTSYHHMDPRRPTTSERSASSGNHELRRTGSESDLEIGILNRQKSSSRVSYRAERIYGDITSDGYNTESSVKTALDGIQEEPSEHKCTLCKTDSGTLPKASPSLQAIKSSLVNVVQESSGLNPVLSENLLVEVIQHIKETTHKVPVRMESLLERLTLSSLASASPSKALNSLERVMLNLTNYSRTGIKASRRSSVQSVSSSEQNQFLEQLETLRKSLVNCDRVHATQLLQLGQHAFAQELSHLYNLESPRRVKKSMLDIFLIICTLDKEGRAILLSTTLPIYFARDLMAQNGNDMKERKLFIKLVDILVTLLACGESMPDPHLEILGTGFINFVFTEIETIFSMSSENEYDKISDERFSSLINLILAYNLQFSNPSKENIVLKVLADTKRRPAGFFTILLELFKKAYDPLQAEEYCSTTSNSVPHSVFKMIKDICSSKRTSLHFTNSDKKILIEIVLDGLFENHAGNTRLGYLHVFRVLFPSLPSGFNVNDVRTSLLNVLLDSDPLAVSEHQLIREMSREFPSLFIRSISRAKINLTNGMVGAGARVVQGSQPEADYYLSS